MGIRGWYHTVTADILFRTVAKSGLKQKVHFFFILLYSSTLCKVKKMMGKAKREMLPYPEPLSFL